MAADDDTGAAPEPLPAWSLERDAALALTTPWPLGDAREWAWAGARGEGVRVAILDSGVDARHPRVGDIQSAVVVVAGEDGELRIEPDDAGDVYGHGTACAGIVRTLAPAAEIHSIRVLGAELTGGGAVMLAGLRHAIEERYDVINLSLSTTRSKFVAELHDLADRAYFGGSVVVASAHNMPVESWPWRFSAVVSVGSHAGDDPFEYFANAEPPVEFAAPGVDVEVAWSSGATIRASGNSFATPHIAGLAALIRSKHPGMTPFEVKSALRAAATNVGGPA